MQRPALRDLPRVSAPGVCEPPRPPARLPLLPDDRLSSTRLTMRVRALAAALDDLPGEAARFRRWQTRHAALLAADRAAQAAAGARAAAKAAEAARLAAAGVLVVDRPGLSLGLAGLAPAELAAPMRHRRLWPLRAGRPPGGRRKPTHEVHALLAELNDLAVHLLHRPDTS